MPNECHTADCTNSPSESPQNMVLFARQFFGPSGKALVDGYCDSCATQRLWMAWLTLHGCITLILLFAALDDWRVAPFAIGTFLISYSLYRRQRSK